jgi:hypothetical protein
VVAVTATTACSRDRASPSPRRIVVPPPMSAMPRPAAAPFDPGYVGPEVCGECHRDKLDSASETSHFLTSRPASRTATAAPLGEDAVVTAAGDETLRLIMLEQDGALYQVGIDRKSGERLSRRADIVIGSGKLGQTFLYREEHFLYQLPATYFAPPVGWRFSPGYPEDRLDFARPVFAQCMECHALWAQPGHPEMAFEHSYVGEFRLGVTCEKCHGPGRDHTAWHRAHPDDDEAHAIVSPGELSRERRDDICLLCHAEHGKELQPAFSFRPGANLREFYAGEPPGTRDPELPDVHSNNQMDRLALSACFQKSEDLACVSCHDPHVFERGNQPLFTARCLECHPAEQLSPSRAAEVRHDAAAPCVECHMPKSKTEIALRHDGQEEARAYLHDHKIGIYPSP